MNISTEFIYSISNLYLFHAGNIAVAVAIIAAGILLVAVCYFVFVFIYGDLILRREAKLLEHKKSVLQELILMKDIQTEIEKEIEKAMLNQTFSG
jgi:hypothetical protein